MFRSGDIVYLESGNAVRYVAQAEGGGHIVRQLLYDGLDIGEDESPSAEDGRPGKPMLVNGVYGEPPVEIYHSRIAELQAKAGDAELRIAELRTEEKALTKRVDDLKKTLPTVEALEHVEEFIAGKITHFVIDERYGLVSIAPFAEAIGQLPGKGHRESKLKLLSLFGDSKGRVSWGIGEYADNSGGCQRVYPCLSRADAEATARHVIAEKCEDLRGEWQPWTYERLEKAVELIPGATLPDDLRARARGERIAQAISAEEKAKAELEKATLARQEREKA